MSKYIQDACPSTRKDDRIHQRLTILTVSMTFTFYLSWTPYALCSLFTLFQRSLPQVPNVIAILMAKSGTVINPILYIFLNNDVSVIRFSLSIFRNDYCLMPINILQPIISMLSYIKFQLCRKSNKFKGGSDKTSTLSNRSNGRTKNHWEK